MGKIAVLNKQTAELIAAGEVVDRPASVAKELIENAIDAGATAVTVEIERGGILYLRVTDNGSGILREDIPTAFLRHATSKIREQGDLDTIRTLGFRGEALAAVSAVSRVELTTRTADELAGSLYRIEGGEEASMEDAGCPEGTTIVVRDLFYNTPARMKFLKKDISEANAVSAVVDRQALSHPEVAFTFIRDGKTTLRTPGDGKLLSAIYQVCGREFAASLIPVAGERGGIWVKGFVCKPTACRPNRNLQYFYINGRLVKSRTMMAALEQAYKNAAMVGKFPACVLHMNIPYQTVDVNVHPTKMEVRFSDEKRIFDAVYYGTKTALAAGDARPQIQLKPEPQKAAWSNPKERMPERAAVQAYQQVLPTVPQPAARHPVAGRPPEAARHPEAARPPEFVRNEPETGFHLSDTSQNLYQSGIRIPSLDIEVGNEPPLATAPGPVRDETLPDGQGETPSAPEEPEAPLPVLEEEQQVPIRYIGELFQTYVLCEQGEELVLLDKHAAHERILYEELKKNEEPLQQMLLVPDDFGGSSVMVRALPLALSGQDVKSLMAELAGGFMDHRRSALPERLDWLYHSVACRAAVKAGNHSEPAELESLALRVLSGKDIMYCPHGRPVAIRLTRKELEKQFGRIQ